MVLESNTLDVLFVKDGQQGEDGKVLYTWIKYAKDANGTGMTDDPNGAIYIGISYNNESSIESNDPTQYAWTKIQGADGKKGEDAYTIFLENENISFATDKNRNPLSEQAYTSGITIMKGAKPVTDFIIGDIAKTQGIAVAKTDTAIAISVVNGNPLPNDSGEIEIPITVGGTVFKKILTWTCAKKGDQGEQGERGLQGIQGPQGIQGVAGKDGTNGKTTYFHIKYSSVANPTSSSQLTETPSTYIGTYVDFTETDSTDPKKYTWSQFVGSQGPKGEQGIAGVGVDGKTSYLHIAYANSADGKTGFSTSDSTNKSYIGQYTDFTPNDSTDYTKYSWSLIRGKDGTDGVSPTVSVTKNGKTTTITITDKNGTHTQTVKDGTDGTPGQTGKDGKTTYFHVKYSNDGGKTFTSNSGEDTGIYMGSYTDYIEADSIDVKKYNWVKVKGDKGDTGQKGQDGTSVKITSKSVTYQTSTSGTTAPTGTWSTTVPTVNNGQYLWTKTTVQYSDGNKTEAYSVSYKGTNGMNGTSVTVSKTEVTYQVSTSGTTAPTGTWQATMPSCDQGQYLWTKTYVKYSDGKDTTSYSVSYKGVDGKKFAWNLIKYGKGDVKKGFFKNFSSVNATEEYGEITLTSKHSYIGIDLPGFVLNPRQYEVGEKVTWSYDIMYTKWDFPTGSNRQEYWIGQRYTNAPSGEAATGKWASVTSHDLPVVGQNGCELNKWFHVEVTKTIPTPASSNVGYQGCINFYNSTDISATVTLRMKNVKLEYGDTATPWSPAQSDLEGRGVSQTVQYYLATSQASGVTSSTSGWSTDITTQKLTADKKYLWNCYQTKYSDGTSEPISTPKVIGVYGDKGQKGDNAKNLSITPSSQYFKSTDGGKTFAPNTITIKPTIQGEINFGKWQYSIDGGVSFADVVSGQTGLTINNNVLTVSKDSSLYSDAVTMVTFRAVASDSSFYDTCSIAKIYDVIDAGDGRNLLLNTSSYRESNPLERTGSKTDDYSTYPKIITSIDLSANQKYTLQAKTDSNWAAKHDTGGHAPSEKLVGLWLVSDDTNTFLDMSKGYAVFTAPKTTKYKLRVNQYSNGTDAYTIHLWDIKLEKGQSASGWSAAPEDVQTAILSTKSEISDVSLKVDKNKQAIEQRVEKTTYQQDLNLVKGDISKANEGLNKWRYEIYPKSLFASEYQGKSTMDVFAKNTNLTPSQSVLINDTDLSIAWNYAENYIGYALTFTKFSAAKSVAITFAHDDGAHIYLNGKLIGGSDAYNRNGESLTLGFVKGWNCIEVVVNEGGSTEGFTLGTTISALSECQLMNCYYGTPVARQSHITNQLVENTTNINGISTKVSKVTSVIGDNGENFTSFKKDYSDFKQTMNGFKTTVGQTYVTKDDFNDLQIGGRNLLLYSANLKNGYYTNIYDTADETFKGCSVFKVNHAWNGIRPYFNKHITERNVIKAGDVLTYSVYAKTDDTKEIDIMMFNRTMDSDSGQGAIRGNQGELKLSNDWKLYSVTFKVTESMLSVDKGLSWFGYELCNNTSSGKYVYFACPKLENSNKPTDWTPAPEDVNGKIVNVETIANQTANKLEWIVKGGDSSSNFTLTDRVADLVAERINFKGLVTFSGLSTDAKSDILNSFEVGGRNLIKKKQIQGIDSAMLNLDNFLKNGTIEFNVKSTNDGFKFDSYDNYEPNSNYVLSYYFIKTNGTITKFGGFHNGKGNIFTKYTVDGIDYESSGYSTESSTVGAIMNDGNRHRVVVCFTTPSSIKTDDAVNFTYIQPGRGNNNPNFGVKIEELKLEKGNKATDWTPAPEDVSQDATNKATQALADAKNYSSNAVKWVTNNGSSTTSLNSMVKKWTDGAVSDTVQINGGWIKANTITASKIAIGDFTNYCQLDKDTASSYGFTATDDTKGVWFTASPIDRNKHISQWFTCEGGQKLYVEYDLSTTVKGKVEASDTDISYLTSGIMIYAANGAKQIVSYTRSKGVTATSDGAITHVSLVETLPADTRFFKVVLQTNGQGNTFSGTLKIRNPQVRKATTGKLIVDGSITADKIAANAITADKIATDAIKSHNYISSGGTQGSFLNLKDGSFTAPNLSWDLNGNLIAKNANLSGEITATNGSIGKYKITDQWLITGSGSTATGIGGNQAFWAGAEDSNSAPFRVGYDGKLYANGATISGDITATTGKIGDLTLKDGILTGTGSYSEPYTEDDDGTVTSTITTNYITKLFGKGLTIDSTVKYSDEDDVYSYKVSVLPDEISFTDGEEIGMLGAGGLQILQVNDNSDSYSSEANEVSLSSGASNFYYTTPVNQTTDKYLHVCFSADGASFMASQGDKFNSFDIGYSSAKYSGNFAANKFVYTGNSLNYVECLEANDTTNVYFHSSGYYSFRVNNEGNWSNETQSVYITERGISVPGKIGLYSQEMSNYVARYYVAGSTKSTAIGNNSYQTRIYGSSVWANKAVSTSDVRLKQDFQSLDKFEDLYMQLQPVSFKYIDGYDKSEDRYFGLKAQPTEQLFEDMGENPDDYAMFNKFGIDHEDIKERIGYDVDFDEEHGLDYTNLITLNTHMVQKTRRELAELQKENAELKDMLKTIVEKINM
jgi:hypothetical protein